MIIKQDYRKLDGVYFTVITLGKNDIISKSPIGGFQSYLDYPKKSIKVVVVRDLRRKRG